MILTKEEIIRRRELGQIVIEPFCEDLVSINSVDVRLGDELWQPNKNRPYRDLYNPNPSDWIMLPKLGAGEIRTMCPGWCPQVPDNHPCFVLQPGEFYLATSLEAIGAKNDDIHKPIVPEMKAKSTVGRQGLTVALCAGLGDIGYVSRWALEVRVAEVGSIIPIAVGTPIAQVVFHEAYMTKEKYNGELRYQNDKDVRFLPKPLKVVI